MESKFNKLRQELNDLGYTEKLTFDNVPLVHRLLSDLKTTTKNLQKYMKISQQAIEERDSLQIGAEPYKCDNAKLIRECNDLHLAFIQFKEQHEKVQKDLRTQVVSLESQLQNCELENRDLKKQIKQLKVELSVGKGAKLTSKTEPSLTKVDSKEKSKGFQLSSAMACAEERIAYLSKEIDKLKYEHLQLAENNSLFKTQIHNRDEEIIRLKDLLEGGRPVEAIKRDCCYKNIDNKIGALQDEINMLKRDKNTLHNQLKDSLAKQHEAMRRALHLAERNKQLEKEMKDIDQIALAVEAECNSTVKNNAEKVTRLQDRMNESVIIIQNLEREVSRLNQDKMELSSDLDAIKLEKKHLQTLLDNEIDDKKRLTDRINSFTIIEHDLNMEIDRLVRITGEQKRKIAELECHVTDDKVKSSSFELQRPAVTQTDQPDRQPYSYLNDNNNPSLQTNSREAVKPDKMRKSEKPAKSKHAPKKRLEHKSTCKKSSSGKSASDPKVLDNGDALPPAMAGYGSQVGRCCCEAGSCMKNLKELLDKEMEYRQTQAIQQIESLKQEKEYYMKEYHKICDELRNIPTRDKPDKLEQQSNDLHKKIEDKNQIIEGLHDEIRTLSKEKYSLLSVVEGQRDKSDADMNEPCNKGNCKRSGRELELLRNEVKHMEKENESLKRQVQALSESTIFDQERMKKAFQEMEEHIRKLEDERRELITYQGTNRSNMTHLEEEYNLMKEQLRTTQNELNNQRASYTQLKNLHDQTDRALADAQSQLLRAETELANLESRMNNTHRETAVYEKEIARLQGDLQVMKMQLSKIDKEKDDLLNVVDEKTERIAALEDQLKDKKNTVLNLEMELRDLRRKLGQCSSDSACHEQVLRSSRQEIAMLQQEYENEKKLKESALQENRRLQSDLSSVTCDCRDTRKELDIARRQVEDLKRQLQHYVAEVKRTEDLISQKELERSEILDQFKCLSEEANILESSNHTLENEATQSRVQLSVALDHASDLERKMDNQEAVIRSYEKQIAELTRQVACLEIQMKQGNSQHDRIATELKQMKDLCVRLDHEKDALKHQLHNRDDQHGQVERNIDRLSRENDDLRRALDKDRNSLDGVEKLLNEARQEVIEQRILNQDLQSEISRMKSKVEELQERLTTTAEQLDLYQDKALEYSQQNKQLRREIANERFFRAREDDTKRYILACPKYQDSKFTPNLNNICYKLCNKDKCPDTKTKATETKVSLIANRPQSPKLQEKKPYCECCNKNNCSVHYNKNSNGITPKSPDKMGTCRNIDPKFKTCRCTHTCSCPRAQNKPPSEKNSRFVSRYSQNYSAEQGRTSTDLQNWTQLDLVQLPDGDSQKLQKTYNISKARKVTDIPSPGEISNDSLSNNGQKDERTSDTNTGTFKNVLTVEGPGIECCISRYKVVQSKSSSPT